MSMSVRCEGCGLEYAGARRLGGLFPQPSNLRAGPRYLRMLGEVVRFHRHARRVLDRRAAPATSPSARSSPIGGYSRYFVEHFMLPVVSACGRRARTVSLSYPARYLFTFLDHHGMLVGRRLAAVAHGRRRLAQLRRARGEGPDRGARRPPRSGRSPAPATASRSATTPTPSAPCRPGRRRHPPGPGAARCWPTRPPTSARCSARSRTRRNETWLHHDTSVLPRAPRARASWNYLKPACSSADAPVLVSYDMNRLQRLAEPDDYVVTLNGAGRVDPDRVLATMQLRAPDLHPGVGGRAAPAARAERRHASPSPAPTTAGASTRTAARPGVRAAAALGVGVSELRPHRPHARGALRRRASGTSASTTLDRAFSPPRLPVAGRPRRAAGAAALAAPVRPVRARATTSATRTARSGRTSTPSSPPHGVDLRRRAGADAGQRPGARLRVQPDHRVLVPPARRRARLRRRRGAQHLRRAALLPAATRRRRAGRETAKDFYVSPFLDRRRRLPDGAARARRAARGLGDAAPARRHRAGRRHRGRRPAGRPPRPRWSACCCAARSCTQRTSALIRRHGIALWLRRLPVVPRPTHVPQEGVQ